MTVVGNEKNMEMVRKLMLSNQAGEVNLGGNLKNSVDIDYISEFGNHYVGRFVFKKPTMKDVMRMGAIKSELLREAGVKDAKLVDNVVLYMASVISTLKVVAVQRPEWLLKPEDCEESDVLYHVFDKFEEWENSFRKSIQPEQDGAGEATAGTEGVASTEQVESAADRSEMAGNDAGTN